MTYQHPLTTAQDPTALPPFTAKLHAHGETRRVRLARDLNWADFDQQIRSSFPHLADPHVHYTVTYHDDDEDEISLSTTEELREALATNEQLGNPKGLTFAIVSDDMSDSGGSASIASWRASVVSGPLLVPADEADAMNAMDVDSESPVKPNKSVHPEQVPLPSSPSPVATAKDDDLLQSAMDAMDEDDKDESVNYPPARASTPSTAGPSQQENVIRIHISSGANDNSKPVTGNTKPAPANGPSASGARGCPYTKPDERRFMDPFSAAFFGGMESDDEADSESSDGEAIDPVTELLAAMGVIPPPHQSRQSHPACQESAIAHAQAQAAAREHAHRQAAAAELSRRRAARQAQLVREAALRGRQQAQREREAAIRRAQAEREAAIRAAAMERERQFRIAQHRAAQEATARRVQAEREAAYWAQQERIARQRAAATAQARSRGPCAGAFVPTFATDDQGPRFVIHPGWSW